MASDKILIEIKSSEKIIFSSDARSFSSVNESGPFDILPYHENFFSIIQEKIIVIDTKDKKTEIKVNDKGILKVMENKLTVFLGIETVV